MFIIKISLIVNFISISCQALDLNYFSYEWQARTYSQKKNVQMPVTLKLC